MIPESVGDAISRAVDKQWADRQGAGFRTHLGGSIIGRKCARSIWYNFRWAYVKRHTGRILRLFQRGHEEEPRLVRWLRDLGLVITDLDPDTGKQLRIVDYNDHFGGSLDGIVTNAEGYDLKGTGLLEFKTHGDKSFKDLISKGLISSKQEHYAQMQTYMRYRQLEWGLYVAINKNTDDLKIIAVEAKPEIGEQYSTRALQIIESRVPPPRISENPSWWTCKMCDYRHVCHQGKSMARNCRTCSFVEPMLEGEVGAWYCHKHMGVIPQNFMYEGCGEWTEIQ